MIKYIVALLEKIPVWKRLKTLPDKVDALEKRIQELEARTPHSPKGEPCKYCQSTDTILEKIEDDPSMPEMVEIRTYRCNTCGNTYTKSFDKFS